MEILAIIKSKSKEDQVVVVSQFRPPIGNKVLEFPAGIVYSLITHTLIIILGLIDAGETPDQAALRELKEECGYSDAGPPCIILCESNSLAGVKIVGTSPIAVMEPGMSNANGILVNIEVFFDKFASFETTIR